MTIREALDDLIKAVEKFERAEGCANDKIAALATEVSDPLDLPFLFDEFVLWLEEANDEAARNYDPEDDDA